jgi:hypothetical protein
MRKGVDRRIPVGKIVEKRALYASLALALLVAPCAGGQPVEAAPIPAQIITSEKVFISNGGVDSAALLSNVPVTPMDPTTGSSRP